MTAADSPTPASELLATATRVSSVAQEYVTVAGLTCSCGGRYDLQLQTALLVPDAPTDLTFDRADLECTSCGEQRAQIFAVGAESAPPPKLDEPGVGMKRCAHCVQLKPARQFVFSSRGEVCSNCANLLAGGDDDPYQDGMRESGNLFTGLAAGLGFGLLGVIGCVIWGGEATKRGALLGFGGRLMVMAFLFVLRR